MFILEYASCMQLNHNGSLGLVMGPSLIPEKKYPDAIQRNSVFATIATIPSAEIKKILVCGKYSVPLMKHFLLKWNKIKNT